MLPGISMPIFPPIRPAPIASAITDNWQSSANQTTYTASGRPVGAPNAKRFVLACAYVEADAPGADMACSLNGEPMMPLRASEIHVAGFVAYVSRWFLTQLHTGTTANFEFGIGSPAARGALALWNVQATWRPTIHDYDFNPSSGILSIDAPKDGTVFAFGRAARASSAYSALSVSGLDKNFGPAGVEGTITTGAGHRDFAAAVTPQAIDLAWTGGSGTVQVYHSAAVALRH